MAVTTTSLYSTNPLTGTFGTGNVKFFLSSTTWTIPPGVGKLRIRLWGGGGYSTGSGGGFALLTIYNLYGVTSVPITVGAGGISGSTTGGTSSFGSYVSATGGVTASGAGGIGVNGDLNYSGGIGSGAGGGCASVYGSAAQSSTSPNLGGAGGGGAGSGYPGYLISAPYFVTSGGYGPAQLAAQFNLDWIGTGYGGSATYPPVNGGGGGQSYTNGAFPGGGGYASSNGAQGLVIVEW